MASYRSPLSGVEPGRRESDDEIYSIARSVCASYQLDFNHLRIAPKDGVHGGLGNAIPIPIPYRRRYVVRFHSCIREAGPLAIRGLFAHELMHVLHYSRASYADLWRFMLRYAAYSVSSGANKPVCADWVRRLEHLTDLMAVRLNEGESIAEWKRFKSDAIARGLIVDSWSHLYLRDDEILALANDDQQLDRRIDECVTDLEGLDPFHPFARKTH